jgi:putative hemolysin
MTSAEIIVISVVAMIALVFSALFAGLETGLYTLNRVRLTVRASRGDQAAARLQQILGNPTNMLSTLLVANNLVHYVESYCIAMLISYFGFTPGQSIAINACLLVPLLFIFADTLPKDLFRTHTDRWSYKLSGFLIAVRTILRYTGLVPLVEAVGNLVAKLLGTENTSGSSARQRMSQLIKEGMGAGVLTEAQTTLADRALAIRDRAVRTVMVPWKKMLCIAPDADRKARELHIRYRSYTRLPVVDRDGKVVGILSLLDSILDPEKSTRQLMQPPLNLTPDTPVREALHRMRSERQSMAIIIHPTRGLPLGMVTIKDLIEPLVGELGAW